jgi:hypothetical protein
MSSISFSVPWQAMLVPRFPELRDGFQREWPGITVVLETGSGYVYADLEGDVDPAEGAHAAASWLAALWPGFLAPEGICLEVSCGGAAWGWEPHALVELQRRRAPREAWLGAASFDPAVHEASPVDP